MPWIEHNGMQVHVKMARTRPQPMCSWCGKRRSLKLCDFKHGSSGRACDKPLCTVCAVHKGEDEDYCPNHVQEGLF